MNIKEFFTHKKYFFQRHSLVVGVFISWFADSYYKMKSIEKWTDIFWFLLAAYLVGLFFNAITYVLADVFCEDKMCDRIMKDD